MNNFVGINIACSRTKNAWTTRLRIQKTATETSEKPVWWMINKPDGEKKHIHRNFQFKNSNGTTKSKRTNALNHMTISKGRHHKGISKPKSLSIIFIHFETIYSSFSSHQLCFNIYLMIYNINAVCISCNRRAHECAYKHRKGGAIRET